MGKLYNFDKIKWKPFQHRIGNISVTNFWIDERGNKKPLQSHLDHPKYSFFELVKWEANNYYGKLQEYLDDDWVVSFGGEFLQKGGTSISLSFFTRSPESCYMLAMWTKLDHDECSPDLKFVGSRPMDLSKDEQATFMELATLGQKHIEKVLRKRQQLND